MTNECSNANDRKKIAGMIIFILFMALLSNCAPYPATQTTSTEEVPIAVDNTANPYPAPSDVFSTPSPQETPVPLETILAAATTAIFEFTASPYPTPLPGDLGIHSDDEYTKLEMLKIGVRVENAWGGIVDGNRVSLWAGSLVADPNQGAIYVFYNYPYRGWQVQFPTAEKHGSLRIVAEQNNRLELVANDGSIFYFDVPSLSYVSSFDEFVFTATPPPTYTPPARPTRAPTLSGYPQPSTSIPIPISP